MGLVADKGRRWFAPVSNGGLERNTEVLDLMGLTVRVLGTVISMGSG